MANDVRTTKCFFSAVLLLCVTSGTRSMNATGDSVYGFRAETSVDGSVENGEVNVFATQDVWLRLFGRGFNARTKIAFTFQNATAGSVCDDMKSTESFQVSPIDLTERSAQVMINLPTIANRADGSKTSYYLLCVKQSSDNSTVHANWIHQGDYPWLRLNLVTDNSMRTFMPLWIQICVISALLFFSGLFSGLNLGLMSLDKTELKIVVNCGSERERKFAKTIAPVRNQGNFLLCTILLGNVLVNNTLTILMDNTVGSGVIAVVAATLGIVIFGEIMPQAICSRHGLEVGARTIWFVKFFMFVTFPLSFPISKLLDKLLGEEIGNTYNRERLRELLKVTQDNLDLCKDEVKIITGALELSKKTVKDIMTELKDVYSLEYSMILDFNTISEIMKTGYTRIPVFEKERNNICALLNIKDLAFIDPDDKTPLKTVCKFYNHPVNFVFEDACLDVMLEEFKKGRFHLSFVQRVNSEGVGDPFYETIGVVTLEDIIEEIIQAEIIDETDTIIDNRWRIPRKGQTNRDFSVFNTPDDVNYPRMAPQLMFATFQFLSTSVEPFRSELVSETVLQRLLRKNILVQYRAETMIDMPSMYLYERGRSCDYFILILQGRVLITIGSENMTFEGGPFMYFGVQAFADVSEAMSPTMEMLSQVGKDRRAASISDVVISKQCNYVPDFTVKALSDLEYLRIARPHYIAAVRATCLERSPSGETTDAWRTMDSSFHRTSAPATFGSQGLPTSEPTSLTSSLSDKAGSLGEVAKNVTQPTSILSQHQHSPSASVTSDATPPPSPKVTFMTKI